MKDIFHINADEIVHETERAFLVVLDDGEEVWLPKSQIEDADSYDVGPVPGGVMIISEWLAGQNGWV